MRLFSGRICTICTILHYFIFIDNTRVIYLPDRFLQDPTDKGSHVTDSNSRISIFAPHNTAVSTCILTMTLNDPFMNRAERAANTRAGDGGANVQNHCYNMADNAEGIVTLARANIRGEALVAYPNPHTLPTDRRHFKLGRRLASQQVEVHRLRKKARCVPPGDQSPQG